MEKQICTWPDLYSAWKIQLLYSDWNGSVTFTPLLVSSPPGGLRIGAEICDWWPTKEMAVRRAALEHSGTMGVYWRTNKGTCHTADLLYQHQADPEIQAGILLAASLWDKLKHPPLAWRGDIYRLVEAVFYTVTRDSDAPFEKHRIETWHHAMRDALPVEIVTDEFAEFSQPRAYSDLVYLAFLEATLSTSLWTTVVVSHIGQDESDED